MPNTPPCSHMLTQLTAELGIRREEVWTFGNDYNDTGMLQWSGHGVATRDAPQPALEAAAEVMEICEEDGVAVVLERIMAAAPGQARL